MVTKVYNSQIKKACPDAILETVNAQNMLRHCFFWGADADILRWLRAKSPEIVLMAPRWMYPSIEATATEYDAQIIEFNDQLDDLQEIALCRKLGLRSMVYSQKSAWCDLSFIYKYQPDMVNLDRPDRFKIINSYPAVGAHFHRTDCGGCHGR